MTNGASLPVDSKPTRDTSFVRPYTRSRYRGLTAWPPRARRVVGGGRRRLGAADLVAEGHRHGLCGRAEGELDDVARGGGAGRQARGGGGERDRDAVDRRQAARLVAGPDVEGQAAVLEGVAGHEDQLRGRHRDEDRDDPVLALARLVALHPELDAERVLGGA